jgi:hypothetical protein
MTANVEDTHDGLSDRGEDVGGRGPFGNAHSDLPEGGVFVGNPARVRAPYIGVGLGGHGGAPTRAIVTRTRSFELSAPEQ